MNCMSTPDPHSHSGRRWRVAPPYLKGPLQSSTRLHKILRIVLLDRFIPRISGNGCTEPVFVEALSLCFATAADIVSGFIFGLTVAPNLVEDRARAIAYQRAHSAASSPKMMFWAQELPSMCGLMSYLCLDLKISKKAKSFLEAEILSLCKRAEATRFNRNAIQAESSSFPGLYYHLREASTQLQVASEVLDHLKATGEILSITVTQALYELSRNNHIQLALRSELSTLWRTTTAELPSAKDLVALPLLNAVVQETLRLRPTAPDGQPRTSPIANSDLFGYQVPANVRISTYSHLLHRAGPFDMRPGTDIEPRHWAFGIGARDCLGKHMATQGQY